MTIEPPTLSGETVFLSASFPSGQRAEAYEPYDPEEVADAVTAVARAVFVAGGRIRFGGHPTISPLVLLIAAEHEQIGAVDIFQSGWFDGMIPAETVRLQELGYGQIHWTPRLSTLQASLSEMRRQMIETRCVGGVFVGGMEGINDEWALMGELQPETLRIPLHGPGGAAARLTPAATTMTELREPLTSRRYPVIAHAIVSLFARGPS